MADRFAVVHTSTGTGTGTQSITSSDIQGEDVQWAILLIYGTEANGVNTAYARISVVMMGFPDGVKLNAENRCVANRAADAQGAVSINHTPASSSLGFIPSATASSTSTGRCIFDSRTSNGFLIEWTVAPDIDCRMTAIFGGGHANVFVGQDAATTVAGENTDPAFEPDLLVVKSVLGSFGSPHTFNLDTNPGLGFCINDGNESQVSIYGEWPSGASTTDSDVRVASTLAGGGAAAGVERTWSVTGFTANGWTRQATIGTVSYEYLAIQFTDALTTAVAVETLPAGTGVTAFTDLGIQPQLVIHAANLLTVEDALTDGPGGSTWAVGAFTANGQGCGTMSTQEGLALAGAPVTDANTRAEDEALVLLDHLAAVAAQATFSSFNPTGFSLDFSVATAGRMVCLAIGAGDQVIVAGETCEITDGVILLGARSMVVNETVEITDGFAVFTNEIHFNADPQGTTIHAAAARGTALQGGAVAGAVLG